MTNENEVYYVGEKKVRGIREVAQVTPLGSGIVEVEFIDKTVELMPKIRYEAIVSHKSLDPSACNERFTKKVASNIYGMLLEYGVKLSEVDHIIQQTIGLVNGASVKATNTLWGVEYEDQRTLSMINDVLIKHGNGITATGSGSDQPDQK